MVVVDQAATLITSLDMTAHGRGPAGHDCLHDADLAAAWPMLHAVCLAVGLNDLR